MDGFDLLSRLGVALAIGLLIGLERGWKLRGEEEHSRAAGFRTFALTGLMGGVAAALAEATDALVLGFLFLGYLAVFGGFHWLEASRKGIFSATSVVAGALTFALGAYAVVGDLLVGVSAAVAMALLLALREPLHRWVASLSWHEIRAVLILLAMTFLLLPVLPNQPIDPWQVLNPYEIWLYAILIAAISFGGYVAVRVLGDRLGVITAAIAGGLASSTATTLALSRMGRENVTASRLLSAGVLISGAVMAVRVGVVATLLNAALLPLLAPPLLALALGLAVAAGFLMLGNQQSEAPRLAISNPLELGTALRLAAFIAVIILAAELVQRFIGDAGVYVVAAVSGVADVDAVTISMARARDGLALATASTAIAIAVGVNTISKAVIAIWAGGRHVGVPVAVASAAALAVAAAALVLWR